jgi:cytochrome b involved in lipid metabolism
MGYEGSSVGGETFQDVGKPFEAYGGPSPTYQGGFTAPTLTQTPPSHAKPTTASTTIILTPEEVAKHNKPHDCWIIIDGRVYNVTAYIPHHPAGAKPILKYCGRDATRAFAEVHSLRAWGLLEEFYIR